MYLKFEKVLKNLQNHLNLKNLMFLMYHLFLKFEKVLMNPQNLKNHLNLMFLKYH
jgi:hypothetical protein